jgi:hypothetical protein
MTLSWLMFVSSTLLAAANGVHGLVGSIVGVLWLQADKKTLQIIIVLRMSHLVIALLYL